jgi:hypothetical protein
VSGVIAVIAVLLGLLVVLLAVPVEMAFRFQGIDVLEGQVAVRWLFGLVRLRFRVPKAKAIKPSMDNAKGAAKASMKRDAGRRHANVLAVFRQAAFRRRLARLVKDLIHAAHLRELDLRMRLGLGDPADTGRLWAFVGPLNAAAQGLRNARVTIEPAFMDAVIEVDAQGRLLLIPLQCLGLVFAFALSPPSMRAWRALRVGHA